MHTKVCKDETMQYLRFALKYFIKVCLNMLKVWIKQNPEDLLKLGDEYIGSSLCFYI